MKNKQKHLSLRISVELLRKFDYVSKYEDRSMNWMLNHLIKKHISEFEDINGKINLSDENE